MGYVWTVTALLAGFNSCGVFAKLLSLIAGDENIPRRVHEVGARQDASRAPVFICPLSGMTISTEPVHGIMGS